MSPATKKKLLITLIIFVFFLVSSLLLFVLKHGELSTMVVWLAIFVSFLFATIMFFVMEDSWLIQKGATSIVKNGQVLTKRQKTIRALLGFSLIIAGSSIFLLFFLNAQHIALLTLLISLIIFALTSFYTRNLKAEKPSKEIAQSMISERMAGMKRGLYGGIVFSAIIVLFLILYFLYLYHYRR